MTEQTTANAEGVDFVFLQTAFSPQHTPVKASWSELHDLLAAHASQHAPDKSRLPCVSFADYLTTTNHKKEACTQVNAAGIDIDDMLCPFCRGNKCSECNNTGRVPVSHAMLEQVLTFLHPYETITYTTFRHTPDKPKLRILLRLSRPVPFGDWPTAFAALSAAIPGGVIDPKTKNANRLFYVPANGAQVHHKTGEAFPVEALFQGAPPQTEAAPLPDAPLATKADLKRICAKLKKGKTTLQRRFGGILQNVLEGVPYAEAGGRDDTTYRLCYYIARELPDHDPASIARYFAQAIDAMAGTSLTVEEVAEKIERQQDNVRAQLDAAKEAQDAAQKRNIWQAFAWAAEDRDWPYTEQELQDMADNLRTTLPGLARMWVIQKNNTYWVLTPRGYLPFGKEEVGNAARVYLSPAATAGVSLFTVRGDSLDLKSPGQLVRDYGSVANEVHTHLELKGSRFEERSGVFHEAARPVRDDLEPLDRLSPEFLAIDQWIEALGRHDTMKLKKWLFWSTKLRYPCVSLFLTGAPGAGKNLLASGVARLWGAVPTALEKVFGNFNGAMLNCPLLFADEQLPKDHRGNVRTEELREIIQGTGRQLSRKYLPDATMHGAIRLIIAGNNEELLQFKGQLTENDLLAISERILHIEAPHSARAVLEKYRSQVVRRWVEEDLIARYVLALQDIHRNDFKPEGRFLIRAGGDMVYRTLAHSGTRFDLLEWLVKVLLNPAQAMTTQGIGRLISVSEGRVYVHRNAIEQTWDLYMRKGTLPDSARISRELRNLGQRAKLPGTTVNAYRIDPGHIQAWLEREGTCSVEELGEILEKGIDFGSAPGASKPLFGVN